MGNNLEQSKFVLVCVYIGICILLKYLCMLFIKKIINNYFCKVDLMRFVVNFGNMEKIKVQFSCFIICYFIQKIYDMVFSVDSYMYIIFDIYIFDIWMVIFVFIGLRVIMQQQFIFIVFFQLILVVYIMVILLFGRCY